MQQYSIRSEVTWITLTILLAGMSSQFAEAADSQGSKEEAKSADWIHLFDGKDTDQWRGFGDDSFPDQGWEVQDGWLKHRADAGGGDIITKKEFSEFDLGFEWRAAFKANSGLKYFIKEERGAIGHEYQILDAGSDEEPAPSKGATASFYDVFAPEDIPIKPAGFVNSSRIVVNGNTAQHWLNGKKVLEYELGSAETLEAVENSKFEDVEGFGKRTSGHILLQDHGDEVWYRKIRIRRLD